MVRVSGWLKSKSCLSLVPHLLRQGDNLLVKESSLLHQSLLILRPHSLLMMSMMMNGWLVSMALQSWPTCVFFTVSMVFWSPPMSTRSLSMMDPRLLMCWASLVTFSWSLAQWPSLDSNVHPFSAWLSIVFFTYLDSSLISSSLHLMTSPRFSFSTRSSLFSSWTIFDGVRSPGMFSTSSRISPMKAAQEKRLGMFPLWS